MVNETNNNNINSKIKSRALWLFVIFTVLYLAIAARLLHIQVIAKDEYIRRASAFVRPKSRQADRGFIYDRNLKVLAMDLGRIDIYADMRMFKADDESIENICKKLGLDKKSVAEKLKTDKKIVYIARDMDPGLVEVIKDKSDPLYGIGYDTKTKRVYPAGPLAAQVLGFTGAEGDGSAGAELKMNKSLKGKDGKYVYQEDKDGREILGTQRVIEGAIDGKSVVLTIDSTIQYYAEKALSTMADKFTPEHAVAIVMDPHTGEILALANYPSYDANQARKADPKLWRNRAVSDLFEPGSTQKVFSVAYALNEGYSLSHSFAYCTGREKLKGGRVSCILHYPFGGGHGAATMPLIIKHSCNIGAAHVALKLGAKKFYEYEKAMGMTQKLDAGFPGETAGQVRHSDRIKPLELANNGFGQGLAVTPLHMAAGFCTIANGGNFVQPRIIRELRDSDGEVASAFEPKVIRRVISAEAAATTRRLMAACVKEGTGKTAAVPGREVAGKTGSAQIAKVGGRGYESGAFVSSFMGFTPVENPRIVIAVAVFRPIGSHWGATVAAPVFREIAENTLLYLKVPVRDAQPNRIDANSGPVALLP